MKLSYARRITRPDATQLNPVTFREDPTHAFVGNASLSPEYTDAFELAFQESAAWGTIQVTPYVRRTKHALRFVQRVDAAGVALGTYDNVASAEHTGIDLAATFRRGPLTLLTGGNVYRYRSDAAKLGSGLSVDASAWSARANATWRVTPLTDLQMTGGYKAAVRIEGGWEEAVGTFNVALRRKLWGNDGSATLRITDPFNMTRFGFRTVNGGVVEESRRGFGRIVAISLSRNFGQQVRLRPKDDPEVQGPPPTVR